MAHQVLVNYEGSILLISHNRHFIDSVCNTIYYLSEDGLQEFKGNYAEYKENLLNKKEVVVKDNTISDYTKRKEQQKLENKRKKDIERIEKELENISNLLSDLEKQMDKAGYDRDVNAMMDIQKNMDDLKIKEEELLIKWTEISE